MRKTEGIIYGLTENEMYKDRNEKSRAQGPSQLEPTQVTTDTLTVYINRYSDSASA